ncbi:hypothetical protein [Acidovorax sp. SD340]|uniref:Single-stranded DNA-binding protein n=1 Tax=Acidovorax facilis TaxID=12917 RepID=A0ABV8D7K5_9BURK|nr:hypothetical protein [Acidovorax sp. SD340]
MEAALKTALDGAGVDEAPGPAPAPPAAKTRASARPAPAPTTPTSPPTASGFEDMDDDIPF